VGTRRAVTVEGFPKGEVARDVGAHVLPRGERGSCSRRALPYILQQKV
jgi:hypothetical protein